MHDNQVVQIIFLWLNESTNYHFYENEEDDLKKGGNDYCKRKGSE